MVSNLPGRQYFAWHQFDYPREMRLPNEQERRVADDLRAHLLKQLALTKGGKLHIVMKVLDANNDEDDMDVFEAGKLHFTMKTLHRTNDADNMDVSESPLPVEVSEVIPPVAANEMDSDTVEILRSWECRVAHLDEVTLEEFEEWRKDNQVEFGSVKVEVNLDLLVGFFEKKRKEQYVVTKIEERAVLL